MKKILFIVFCMVSVIVFGFFLLSKRDHTTPKKVTVPAIKKVPSANLGISKLLFVPAWNIPKEASMTAGYDDIAYFGITADTDGLITKDAGYKNFSHFVSMPTPAKKLVTLKLLDSDTNFDILKDIDIERKIIQETLKLVSDNRLNGVVLDLELISLFNDDIRAQISSFVQVFYANAKQAKLSFYTAIYGDTYYRKRPYDIKFIGENSDKILVMAYDFHKASGEPGPNFPLSGRDKYGYDMRQLVADLKNDVRPEKISFIFGMYGYDWTVDEKKRPVRPGKALSLIDMTQSFVVKCGWKNCLAARDPISGEMEVNYVTDFFDPNPATNPDKMVGIIYHDVWFEDMTSVQKKRDFLQEEGIRNYGYWTYGYF